MWKPTKKWGPPRPTGSSPIAVERGDAGNELGLAKQRGMWQEKLASDLAHLAQVRVPKVEIDQIEGKDGHYAISRVHGVESNDLTAIRQHAPSDFASSAVQDAIARASGLIPFYAWTATGDLKDDHLVLDREQDGLYHVTGVDFEATFSWGEADGGTVGAPGIPPAMVPKIDKSRVAATVAAIEAISDEQIRSAVGALPGLSAEERKRIADGLIGRRSKVKERMKAQGWLE
jgi:hypothetical protein